MLRTARLPVDQMTIHCLLDGTLYAVDSNRLGRLRNIPIDIAIYHGPFTGSKSLGDFNKDFSDTFNSATTPI